MNLLHGNLLEVPRGILVHQVNLVGVMGAGIAWQISQKWPHVYEKYKALCDVGALQLGDVHFVQVGKELYVANLAGQYDTGGVATRYTAYNLALPKVKSFADARNLPIFFPFGIGCGLAGGNWEVMRPILECHTLEATLVKFEEIAVLK